MQVHCNDEPARSMTTPNTASAHSAGPASLGTTAGGPIVLVDWCFVSVVWWDSRARFSEDRPRHVAQLRSRCGGSRPFYRKSSPHSLRPPSGCPVSRGSQASIGPASPTDRARSRGFDAARREGRVPPSTHFGLWAVADADDTVRVGEPQSIGAAGTRRFRRSPKARPGLPLGPDRWHPSIVPGHTLPRDRDATSARRAPGPIPDRAPVGAAVGVVLGSL